MAFAIEFDNEFDNEFEHQMPHRTTNHGSAPGCERAPWLVSMAMWVHCMRHVPAEDIPAGELARRAQLSAKGAEMVLKRMSSQVPTPDTLPHYPMVSHRGGFPDGS